MKAETTLHVSAKYLFERIADKTLYDIFQTTGQELSLNELQGYSYLTKIDMYNEAQITITSVLPYSKFQYITDTADSHVTETYKFKSLAQDKVEVTFEQIEVTSNFLKAVANKITNISLGWLKKHNFKKVLKHLETGY